jgi:hypothetical protein
LGSGKSEVILQANKDAKDKSVKKAAQKDSHQIIAKAISDAQNNSEGDSAREQFEQDFESRKQIATIFLLVGHRSCGSQSLPLQRLGVCRLLQGTRRIKEWR